MYITMFAENKGTLSNVNKCIGNRLTIIIRSKNS